MVLTLSSLAKMLIRHEGLKLKPYKDAVGKLTIGVGRNLDDVGISIDEAYTLLLNDIESIDKQLVNTFPWYSTISIVRQDVITDMAFNVGVEKLKQFHNMIAAIESKDYQTAANEMLNSAWAKEVGSRANELAQIMIAGSY